PPDLRALTGRNAFELRQANFRDRAVQLANLLTKESQRRAKMLGEVADKEALEQFTRAEKILKPFQYPVWTLFVVSAILLSVAWSIQEAPSIVQAHRLVERAKGKEAVGDYRGALTLYSDALDVDRESRAALLGAVLTRFAIGDEANREEAFHLLKQITLTKDVWTTLLPHLKAEDQNRILAGHYVGLPETANEDGKAGVR